MSEHVPYLRHLNKKQPTLFKPVDLLFLSRGDTDLLSASCSLRVPAWIHINTNTYSRTLTQNSNECSKHMRLLGLETVFVHHISFPLIMLNYSKMALLCMSTDSIHA